MIINWYGHACYKLQSNHNDIVVAIDPYDNSLGWRAPRITADIALISTKRSEYSNVDAVKQAQDSKLFVIEYPGEYEVGGVFVHAIPVELDTVEGKKTQKEYTLICTLRMDDCTLAHLGALNRMLTQAELDELGTVDILCIPIGGHGVLDAKKATELIGEIEPRIVLPMQYKVAGLTREMDDLQRFLKEFGAKDIEPIDKLKIAKKDLPVDTTDVVILNPL